ncbi:MAG: cyclic nucleotide-binding domain-containing protein, partial [candidate division WOR-3 bacterium]
MIFLIFLFSLLHPYFKENLKGVDSSYFYKEKIKWIFEKERKLNFEVNKKDSFLIFKNKMFKGLKKDEKEENYYKYVYEKDNFMFLLYLFKKEEFKKIREILENKEIKKPEEYIVYLLTCLKLKKEPNILESEKFINSPYFPYILYLNSIFLFKKNEFKKVLENLEKIKEFKELEEDIEFLTAITYFRSNNDINRIENYIKNYKKNFYTDTLYFILANYYYNIKKYKKAKEYINKIENKKFHRNCIPILIEIESAIGEKCDSLIQSYKNEFGENEEFKEVLKKCILNLYSREKFKEVIKIYEKWEGIIKRDVFTIYISSLLKEREYKKGEIIVKQGEEGIGLFIIKNGKVKVSKTLASGKVIDIAVHSDG